VPPPTSLAAVRSRLKPAALAARRRGSGGQSAAGPGVLLRFPGQRRGQGD
jgi:hypothetical protein